MLSCLESTQFHLILDCNLQIEKKQQQYLGKSEEVFPVKVTLPPSSFKSQTTPAELQALNRDEKFQHTGTNFSISEQHKCASFKNKKHSNLPQGPFVSTNCHWGNTYQVDVTDCWLIHSHTRQSVHGAVALKISIIQADCTNCFRLKDRKLIIMQISRSWNNA